MEQKTDRIHPLAPIENIDLELRLEAKYDVKSFKNSVNSIEETIACLKAKIKKQIQKQL